MEKNIAHLEPKWYGHIFAIHKCKILIFLEGIKFWDSRTGGVTLFTATTHQKFSLLDSIKFN